MKGKGGNWDYDSLNHFLWKPKKFVDGTKMNFIGLKKPEERAALIGWLRTQEDSPMALPTPDDIAKEAATLAPPVAAVTATTPSAPGAEAAPAMSGTPEVPKDAAAPAVAPIPAEKLDEKKADAEKAKSETPAPKATKAKH